MENWNEGKSIILAIVSFGVLVASGLSWQICLPIAVGFALLTEKLIGEINFIRNAHGGNLEELETTVEELEERIKKLEEKKK